MVDNIALIILYIIFMKGQEATQITDIEISGIEEQFHGNVGGILGKEWLHEPLN